MSRARLLALVFAPALLLVQSAAATGASGIVVSQVFGGGGNVGAPYAADFVELFNRGSAPVALDGWTLQYAPAAATTWQATPLGGTIPPGANYLVQLAGGAAGAVLPAPDATGTSNLSATSGKVALVRDSAVLSCGGTPGSCGANPLVEDLVGFGGASDYEGSAPAAALTSTTAAIRGGDGCIDSDVNATDLTAGAPAPRNSASPRHLCSSSPPPAPAPTAAQAANVEVEVQPVLSLSLERSTLSFGTTAGATPAPLSERVTVLSNHPAGYTLSAVRSAFTPADLPLALQASAPGGAQLGSALLGGGLVAVPIAPTALTIGSTSSTSAREGDVWPTNVGFVPPFPAVAPGRYTATLTFTVIGR
jgi:spore coat protein U-like protein